MKRLLSLSAIVLFIALVSPSYSQSGLPSLQDNPTSKQLISDEINKMYQEYKTNPTIDLERKIVLFNKTLEILNEPLVKAPATEYAVNSAFLFIEQKYNPTISDEEAFKRLNQKQWSANFNDLVNLLKR